MVTVARRSGRTSVFGAFYDSTLDRVADGAVLGGLALFFARNGVHHAIPDSMSTPMVSVLLLGIIGSFLTSYTRARAEGLGIDAQVGILQRPERIVLLSAPQAFFGLALGGWVLMSHLRRADGDGVDHRLPARRSSCIESRTRRIAQSLRVATQASRQPVLARRRVPARQPAARGIATCGDRMVRNRGCRSATGRCRPPGGSRQPVAPKPVTRRPSIAHVRRAHRHTPTEN